MPTLVVRDSRLPEVGSRDKSRMVVTEGPSSTTYQPIQPPDPKSLNPIFSIDLPSQLTGLQRQLYWTMTGSFTVTGTALNLMQVQDRVALRQFCLQSMCSSVEVQMNNTTLNIGSLDQIIDALLRVGNPTGDAAGTQSACPASMDTVANYNDAVGRLDSPFAPAGDRQISDAAGCPRTVGITGIIVDDGTGDPGSSAGTVRMTINFTVREPIVVPPFSYTDSGREKAIYGLNQVQVKCNLSSFARGLSLAIPAGATVTGITMVPATQTISAVFVTPSDRSLARASRVARPFSYDAPRVQTFFTTLGDVAAGGTPSSQSSNSFQLAVVPEKIVVFVVPSSTQRSAVGTVVSADSSLPSAFCPITSCQIQAGTRGGLLSGATAIDLWAMSQKNGANIPFWQYAGLQQVSSSNGANGARGSGGPLILDVAADLSLPDGVLPGMAIPWTFSVTSLEFLNNYAVDLVAPRLIIMTITPASVTNTGGDSAVCVGGVPNDLKLSEIKDVGEVTSEEYHKLQSEGGFGGSPFTTWLYKVGDTIKHAAYKAGDSLRGTADQIAKTAKSAAWDLGDDLKDIGHEAAHNAIKGAVAAAQKGGRRMPRSMLYE